MLIFIEKIVREVSRMAKDLNCGMEIDEQKAGARYDFQGSTYYFCSSECRDKFAEATLAGINP
jgi:YHS domain-containing protein